MAILGENVAAGGFLFSAGTFWPFCAKMYRPQILCSQPVHFGHFERKCTGCKFCVLSRYINAAAGGFLFSAGTFGPFWVKMYQLGSLCPQPVHFRHFGRKCTGWVSPILRRYILVILAENLPAGGFGTFWILAENFPAGNFVISAGTFSAFWAKMYRLGVFYS